MTDADRRDYAARIVHAAGQIKDLIDRALE